MRVPSVLPATTVGTAIAIVERSARRFVILSSLALGMGILLCSGQARRRVCARRRAAGADNRRRPRPWAATGVRVAPLQPVENINKSEFISELFPDGALKSLSF